VYNIRLIEKYSVKIRSDVLGIREPYIPSRSQELTTDPKKLRGNLEEYEFPNFLYLLERIRSLNLSLCLM